MSENPYITKVEPEEEDQNQMQNTLQTQSINNDIYQQPLSQSIYNNENNEEEDILKKTSLSDEEFDNGNDIENDNDNDNDQVNIIQNMKEPIIQETESKQIISNMEQPLSINNINENPNIFNSYSYSIPKTINNINFTNKLSKNENNLCFSSQPVNINTQNLITSYKNQYGNNDINNNNFIHQSNEPFNINNFTNYNNTTELIKQFPQYVQYDQNINNSTPIPEMPNIINDFSKQSNNFIYSSYIPNDKNNVQNHAQVKRIDEEMMKNPEVKRYVEESEKHIKKYISKLNKSQLSKSNSNNDNNENDINNITFNSKNKSFINIQNSQYMNKGTYNANNLKKSKNKKYQNNNSKYLNPRQFEDFKNFSYEFYINFYDNDDYFFMPIQSKDIIHDQILKNPEKNEIYKGDINSQNQKHGFGILISPNIRRIGRWKNDEFNGWGREINSNGEIYEGKFENDILNGKGIYKYGGNMYIGDFQNYKKHGKGELFTNSYHYIGDFVNDNMNGNGIIENYDEGVYEGKFNNDKINGYGIYKYKNGDFYEGQMKDGLMNGKGKYTKVNGEVFEGAFVNGEYENDKSSRNRYY